MSWSQWFAPVICDRFPLVGQWSPASCVEAVKCQRTSAKRNRDGVHLLRMLSSSRRGVVRADRLKVDVAGMMRSRARLQECGKGSQVRGCGKWKAALKSCADRNFARLPC
jgi:hypothetical protein